VRVIHLSLFWTIMLDSAAWAIIQTGIAYLALRFPPSLLDYRLWLFRPRPWERNGALYEQVFRVRRWKTRLPSAGGTFFRNAFSIRQVASADVQYLDTWVRESCRAELCHWLAILPSLLFFLWNPWPVGFMMIAYAIAFNSPCIIAQRYNRPRLLSILRKRAAQYGQAASPSIT